ncbi:MULTISPECIES: M23 family metallopeptidase [Qipengyuania]|uniref:M23 family metallopeptidase n=2 Tax=Qipengyuania TaxID=1855416 RepID=A0A9Q3RZU7_9SPHN|nr:MULTISPECIES: M23 family metallopeptidase [Qipengyuania]MBY6217407.1 M23 family metallopeptidase [Qipengyuania aquimaris]QZD92441.1 M23 family metallopeptidase [Qipengyuania xiapuensis]
MKFIDRLLTIIITATITSAVWIVAGGSLIENATSAGQRDATRPAEAAPSPSPSETASGVADAATDAPVAGALDTRSASAPSESDTRQLLIPVRNIRASDLTDTFSDSRAGGQRLHEAIDIMAPKGTAVVSAAPGTVEKLFRSDAGGLTIYVRSQDRETIHYYAHLDKYAEGLKEGQRVRRGQRLGAVGSSGNASDEAPHLHFAILQTTEDAEWWEPANAVNPYPLLTQR